MRVDRYRFGEIVIDGDLQRKDVILTPDDIHPNWWRVEGHSLTLQDLHAVFDAPPRVLIVGTGAAGRMRPEAGLEAALAARGITLEAMPTTRAVERFNQLAEQGELVAAALHLTC